MFRGQARLCSVVRGCWGPRRTLADLSDASESQKLSTKDYAEYRKRQLAHLQDLYPHQFTNSHTIRAFDHEFAHLTETQSLPEVSSSLAGRINSIRLVGKKLVFLDIHQLDHKVQVKIRREDFEGNFDDEVKILRRGDILAVTGFPARTQAGELSLCAKSVKLLAPCLKMMPNKQVDLENPDKRFRKRHVDFLADPDKKAIFHTRAAVIRTLRSHLDARDFLEVETPILATQAGGASAEPFRTRHKELAMDMCLRIAPELYLKQLVVGGFDRVYEIGKQFRNEGIDATHNPEFTTCEAYMAYADYSDMMRLTGRLLREITAQVVGSELKVPYVMKGRPVVLDFKSKFNRLDYFSGVEAALNRSLPGAEEVNEDGEDTRACLRALCAEAGLDTRQAPTSAKLLDKLFGHFVEPELAQPTFVMDLPQALSPLAKPHRSKPGVAERFEFYVAGLEVANAYTELNDPEHQRRMFQAQSRDEATVVDEDYVKVLEYGLPPTGGWGMGIDRLTMILTNQPRIKEVILFPALRLK